MKLSRGLGDLRLIVELFALSNLAFLALDIYVAHSMTTARTTCARAVREITMKCFPGNAVIRGMCSSIKRSLNGLVPCHDGFDGYT